MHQLLEATKKMNPKAQKTDKRLDGREPGQSSLPLMPREVQGVPLSVLLRHAQTERFYYSFLTALDENWA